MTPTGAEGGSLGFELVANMDRMTRDRYGSLAGENVARNQPLLHLGRSLAELAGETVGRGDGAIVIAAGPSIRRHDPIRFIRDSGYSGAVIATDSALAYCLRNGVVPDLVVTLDPHAKRIVRWFGDPELTEECLRADDYYRRQDMDTVFADEMANNRALMALMDEHGPKIRIALCTAASEAVVRRVTGSGMKVYWWNPMVDDPAEPDSESRAFYRMNKMPLVNTGGNVGTACWMMAHAVLGKRHVAVTGMDFAYYDDTPYNATQYYHEAVALVGEENLDRVYMRMLNPHTGTWFYTDPAYMWYRQSMLEMVADADCRTYNCSGGGIFFGEGVEFLPLQDFLARSG
jgi:hypothetical protein